MAVDIIVPKLSATMEDALVLKWLEPPGAEVKAGDPIVELETDKTAIEIEATADGFLSNYIVGEEERVAVGACLARIVDSHADIADVSQALPVENETLVRSNDLEGKLESDHRGTANKQAGENVFLASPKAKRLAREHGINLSEIKGAGVDGRISTSDIEEVIQTMSASVSDQQDRKGTTKASAIRRRIAEQVAESRRTIPSFCLDRQVETENLQSARERMNKDRLEKGKQKISVTDCLLIAMADTLIQHPKLLQVWQNNDQAEIVDIGMINIGLVVSVDEGLLIPVLTDLENKPIDDIAMARHAAATAARSVQLPSKYISPCSISLSNLGVYGIDRFEAIISPDQSAILAVGKEQQKIFVSEKGIYSRPILNLTLSVDHRLIDGAVAAQFLSDLADRIESEKW